MLHLLWLISTTYHCSRSRGATYLFRTTMNCELPTKNSARRILWRRDLYKAYGSPGGNTISAVERMNEQLRLFWSTYCTPRFITRNSTRTRLLKNRWTELSRHLYYFFGVPSAQQLAFRRSRSQHGKRRILSKLGRSVVDTRVVERTEWGRPDGGALAP